ncbi:nucleotide pyrophosphatase/phosphodiesterase family protein [Salinimicrobium catena]|uniref:alkaline phosphatase family protein n=1 Tax=Salinimicrobium catena TaxID=390640 RepID=UPI002FE48277
MKKTVVINVVGLTRKIVAEMPFLKEWVSERQVNTIEPVLPAVTCSAQATYLTGKYPEDTGIMGNGWYFKEESEVKFWRQPNQLIQSEKIWETLKKEDPRFTCANFFWWYNMYSSVDYSITPRPMYPADGRKIPDIYTYPSSLRDDLQKELGQFPLFKFWGPATSIEASKWIAKASKKVDKEKDPTLSFIYIPHLDYNFQRLGPDHPDIGRDLKEVDKVCKDLIKYYEGRDTEIILLSEYGITAVEQPVYINRLLRKNGYIAYRNELGHEVFDAGASEAFAVCDHQLAHVYVKDKGKIAEVRELLERLPGVEKLISGNEKKEYHLDHDRAGDIIAVADASSWFCYYYWLDDDKAPDYARTVDIHRKPGYDPAELFVDPDIKFPKLKIGLKLFKKKLGFRTLMDVIPLKPELVKGSHGRKPESPDDWPVFISSATRNERSLKATDVFDLIRSTVLSE